MNLRNKLWQKWGGHVYPSPRRGDAPDCWTGSQTDRLHTADSAGAPPACPADARQWPSVADPGG